VKKLTAAIALLLVALSAPVGARTYDIGVVRDKVPSGLESTDTLTALLSKEAWGVVRNVLNLTGADYTVVQSVNVSTSDFRNGIITRGNGTVDSVRTWMVTTAFPTRKLNGKILNWNMSYIMQSAQDSCGVSVPSLYLMDNAGQMGQLGAGWGIIERFDDASGGSSPACSTGVYGLSTAETTTFPYVYTSPTLRWRYMTYACGFRLNPTPPAGGSRAVLGGSLPAFKEEATTAGNSQFPLSMPSIDQSGVSAGEDTVFVWDRLWAHCAGAQPMTFVSWGGAGAFIADSLVNAFATPPWELGKRSEVALDLLMFGLAHFDSVAFGQIGRRPIFGNMKSPRRIALIVDGALTRNRRQDYPGILEDDTASFYSTLDSLSKYNIPVTFGVNVDSASSFQRDIIKLRGVSNARFTPDVWTGVRSGASTDTRRFVDIFGFGRSRAFVGEGSLTDTGDSTIYTQLKRARVVCDSLFPGRASRFVIPPDDDYSPLNLKRSSRSSTGGYSLVDSLMYAITLAGFNGVIVNGKYTTSNPARPGAATNVKGWHTKAGRYRNAIDNKWLTVLNHTGYDLRGAMHWSNSISDSVAPYDSSAAGHQQYDRSVMGMWAMNGKYDYDTSGNQGTAFPGWYVWRDVKYNFEDYQDPVFGAVAFYAPFIEGQVWKVFASDFSGEYPAPARCGWLQIKQLDSWMRAVNLAAGKTIVSWAHPEDIEP